METKKLKKQFKEKLLLEKSYEKPIKWIVKVRFGKNKDDKFNKELVEYMTMMADGIWETAKEQFESILNNSNNGYIKVENIPAYEDIFGSIKDMINSNQEIMKFSKVELVKLKKQKDKLKDYEKIKDIEHKIWWEEQHLDEYGEEIRFLENMQTKIIADAHYNFDKKKEFEEKEQTKLRGCNSSQA
jgi:hypothetical protein